MPSFDLSTRHIGRGKSKRFLDLPYVRVTPSGCWEWQRSKDERGYALLTIRSRRFFAHRVFYELTHGSIPEGMQIDHLCRNHSCVNVAHLEAVTLQENLKRGIGRNARALRDNHCIRGHEFTVANTYHSASGSRACRHCKKLYQRARVARVKEANREH